MELAAHLNENENARRTWPGNMLFDFFLSVYEDGNMRLYELEALARVIEGILIHADGMAAEAAETEAAELTVEDGDEDTIVLPDLANLDEQGCNEQPGLPEMYFSQTMCDCLDWQSTRRKLPANSPGRLCKHLCRALSRSLDHFPASHGWLRGLINFAGSSHRALAAQPEWRVVLSGDLPVIAAWGAGSNCDIYAPGPDQALVAYSYNLVDRHWNFGNRPPMSHDDRLKRFLVELASEHAERRAMAA